MKTYSLYSLEANASYFVSLLENDKKSIVAIVNVQELIAHSQYKISIINTSTTQMGNVIVSDKLLNTDNMVIIALNFLNNVQDLLLSTTENVR